MTNQRQIRPGFILRGLAGNVSGMGLVLGALFLAASLTPSLIPRGEAVQGALAGICFAAGYGIAVLLRWIWVTLDLPRIGERAGHRLLIGSAIVAALIAGAFLFQAADWQNSIRTAMRMEPVPPELPLRIGAIALVVAAVLLVTGKLIALLLRRLIRRIERVIPRRAAILLGLVIGGILLWTLANGVLFSGFIRVADSSARALDAVIPPDIQPPADPLRTGSPASLVAWEDLGREGRNHIATTPTAVDIAAVTGGATMQPLRAYVGLNAAGTTEDRAALAVAELARIGGFDRSILVVAMPTGTGWLDPAAMTTLEYLHRGDVATVALQYSYLPSWISLLVEPEYSADAGRALFSAVRHHWLSLPPDRRPRLYLYGLSLGAYSSQQSLRLYEMIDQPFAGALWVGPPFVSPLWQTLVRERDPASPEWLPRMDQGQTVRFTNRQQGLSLQDPWGGIRIVYLQYASDPVVFFSTGSLLRRPDWMNAPRGPDVSPDLRWYPIVSFLQLAFDIALALHVPIGRGHTYAYADHIDPWMAVTQPRGWDDAGLARLRRHFLAVQGANGDSGD
ncbi:alpha/beta hydrolase [Paracoccus benzoatiresistens]|uniref:Alpha/beta-hydrolase family protein n=1 Tax=Paracoccus benzoatiresistens TaxID=2997341 RepID=A0ABT4J1I5_9RHOB|nr:alpha/beta-hydrolase family protein [Paracoccus sp. EF6]MCZ0960947.1 alpha/beta-hydrolase family protein [Paracoccus sp. EF6]